VNQSFVTQYMAACPVEISDEDVLAAMKKIPGFIDITTGDFKKIYTLAFDFAMTRLSTLVKAMDVMTREVVFVSYQTPLKEAADKMTQHRISGVPVLDDHGRVVGMISEKDFLAQMGSEDRQSFMGVVAQCLKSKGCVALSLRGQKAKDIMTSPVITVQESTPMVEIATIFHQKNINRVPVVDANNHLLGIVSRGDLVRSTCTL
jgi:CBS domain-containing membrane protein